MCVERGVQGSIQDGSTARFWSASVLLRSGSGGGAENDPAPAVAVQDASTKRRFMLPKCVPFWRSRLRSRVRSCPKGRAALSRSHFSKPTVLPEVAASVCEKQAGGGIPVYPQGFPLSAPFLFTHFALLQFAGTVSSGCAARAERTTFSISSKLSGFGKNASTPPALARCLFLSSSMPLMITIGIFFVSSTL